MLFGDPSTWSLETKILVPAWLNVKCMCLIH
jgi:hypothetical protein